MSSIPENTKAQICSCTFTEGYRGNGMMRNEHKLKRDINAQHITKGSFHSPQTCFHSQELEIKLHLR